MVPLMEDGARCDDVDRLFLTHLHLDHVGDFHVLYDALGWARNSPLHVWGPSGYTPEMGTAYFCEMMDKAALWHDQSKMGIVPSEGMEIIAHEFDYSQFSPDKPRMLVYDQNDVKITAFPAIHIRDGSVSYRLDWQGLSFVFGSDTVPNQWFAKEAKGHGTGNYIEGLKNLPEGGRVALVEDVVTTGGTLLKVIDRVEAAGFVVGLVVTVVDR